MMTASALLILCAASAGAVEVAGMGSYRYEKSVGHWYRVAFKAQSWRVASNLCKEDQAKLAVPKTKEEFQFLQALVRQIPYFLVQGAHDHLVLWLGIYFNPENLDWTTVDGELIKDTGFHQWAGNNGQNSTDVLNPHCAGVDALNPGLRDFWCNLKLAYICQRL